MTDMTVKTAGAEELKGHIDGLVNLIKTAKGEMTDLAKARDEKIGHLDGELKTFGTKFADTEAKVKEIAEKMTGALGQITKAYDAIDKLQVRASQPGSHTGLEQAELVRKNAIEFARLKHHAMDTLEVRQKGFDPSGVTDDFVQSYDLGRKAFARYFRTEAGIRDPLMVMSDQERKGISTLTHGNSIWLPLEMSDQIIECYEPETDLGQFFSSINISGAGVQMLKKNAQSGRAVWKCEVDCTKRALEINQPGMLTIMVGELAATVCATHSMIEDSAIDLEAVISGEAAEQFVNARNDSFFKGTGQGMPNGGLKAGNHLEMESGQVAGTPSGDFTWQDLAAMKWKHQPRFRTNRSWFMNSDAISATMTMADGNGRPIFNEQTINANGLPTLLGVPAREVSQMPQYLDGTGAKVVGSKPVAIGDWKKWYMVVNRKGFSVLRDPFSQATCGVVWHFTSRVGGDVLCPEAAIFMKIV